jgi:hypothetical protein
VNHIVFPGSAPVGISGGLVTQCQYLNRLVQLASVLQKLKVPANGIPTNDIMDNVLLPAKFLNGKNKMESILCFDLFDEAKILKTKWFHKQRKATFLAPFE